MMTWWILGTLSLWWHDEYDELDEFYEHEEFDEFNETDCRLSHDW